MGYNYLVPVITVVFSMSYRRHLYPLLNFGDEHYAPNRGPL